MPTSLISLPELTTQIERAINDVDYLLSLDGDDSLEAMTTRDTAIGWFERLAREALLRNYYLDLRWIAWVPPIWVTKFEAIRDTACNATSFSQLYKQGSIMTSKDLSIAIDGGTQNDRYIVAGVVHRALDKAGFTQVKNEVIDVDGDALGVTEVETILDTVKASNPELFTRPIEILPFDPGSDDDDEETPEDVSPAEGDVVIVTEESDPADD